MRHIICLVLLYGFFTSTLLADSISITLKPAKGLSGTASLNIHEDGSITILEYESPVKISERTVSFDSNKRGELRLFALTALKSYLDQEDYSQVKEYTFTLSIAYTNDGVTKSISSRRINEHAMKLVKVLIIYVQNEKIKAIEKQI